MIKESLAQLQKVDLREVWKSEPGDFRPWLADPGGLKLLGDAIGVDLELEAQEKDVGPFRADILCKDIADNTWVLIENQLTEKSYAKSHPHGRSWRTIFP